MSRGARRRSWQQPGATRRKKGADLWSSDGEDDLPDWHDDEESETMQILEEEADSHPRTRSDIVAQEAIASACHLLCYKRLPKALQASVKAKLQRMPKLSFVDTVLETPDVLYVLLWLSNQHAGRPTLSQLLPTSDLQRTRLTIPASRNLTSCRSAHDARASRKAVSTVSLSDSKPSRANEKSSNRGLSHGQLAQPHLLGYCTLALQRDPASRRHYNVIEFCDTLVKGYNIGQLLYQRAGELCLADAAGGNDTGFVQQGAARPTASPRPSPSSVTPPAMGPKVGCSSPIDERISATRVVSAADLKSPVRAVPAVAAMAAGSLAAWPFPLAPANVFYWMKMEDRIEALGRGGLLRCFGDFAYDRGASRSSDDCSTPACADASSGGRGRGRVGAGPGLQPPPHTLEQPGERNDGQEGGEEAGEEVQLVRRRRQLAGAGAMGGQLPAAEAALRGAFSRFCADELHWEPADVSAYLSRLGPSGSTGTPAAAPSSVAPAAAAPSTSAAGAAAGSGSDLALLPQAELAVRGQLGLRNLAGETEDTQEESSAAPLVQRGELFGGEVGSKAGTERQAAAGGGGVGAPGAAGPRSSLRSPRQPAGRSAAAAAGSTTCSGPVGRPLQPPVPRRAPQASAPGVRLLPSWSLVATKPSARGRALVSAA